MNRKRKLKVLLFLMLTLTLIFAVGCESEEAQENNGDNEITEENEILGGPLVDFQSLDSEDNTVDESIFEDSEVNLIFVWRTG
ncbi:MAG: hypothetical protein ACLFPS_08480 [Clostridia bacterium]